MTAYRNIRGSLLFVAGLLLIGVASAQVRSDDAPRAVNSPFALPFVASVLGTSWVRVIRADGKMIQAREGATLKFGDSLEIPKNGAARIAFDVGCQILVGGGSKLTISEEREQSDGIPLVHVHLREGELRGLVQSKLASGLGPLPFKLKIKLDTAIFGVRGTDFVVASVNGTDSLHVITGLVEVARDPDVLRRGQGKAVAAGWFTSSVKGREIDIPSRFMAGMFLKELHERLPLLEPLFKSAVRDVKSGTLEAKFHAAREQLVDELNRERGINTAEVSVREGVVEPAPVPGPERKVTRRAAPVLPQRPLGPLRR